MISAMAIATADVEATLRLFRALGDETRLRLLAQLHGGEQCVCDLTDELCSTALSPSSGPHGWPCARRVPARDPFLL
jgi:hypothetical protein